MYLYELAFEKKVEGEHDQHRVQTYENRYLRKPHNGTQIKSANLR